MIIISLVTIFFVLYMILILLSDGYIETNPGPFTNKKKRAERKMNNFVNKESILVQRKESYIF